MSQGIEEGRRSIEETVDDEIATCRVLSGTSSGWTKRLFGGLVIFYFRRRTLQLVQTRAA